jgi:hypothetical protein
MREPTRIEASANYASILAENGDQIGNEPKALARGFRPR